jgi:hypothetical protein
MVLYTCALVHILLWSVYESILSMQFLEDGNNLPKHVAVILRLLYKVYATTNILKMNGKVH